MSRGGVTIMKKILPILSLSLASAALVLGGVAALGKGAVNEVKATSDAVFPAPDYTTYVPVADGWIENTDGSAESSLASLIRGRNDRFWSGQSSGFDSQERTFNATDEFVDTIHKANGANNDNKSEGWRGAYRTQNLTLKDNNHRYVSFLFGGGSGDIFVNI